MKIWQNSWYKNWMTSFLLAIVLLYSGESYIPEHRVKSLPGWEHALPSAHYAGRIETKINSTIVDTFYYLVECENDPLTSPLLIWMNGGPGASSLFGLFGELGPFLLNKNSIKKDKTFQLFHNPYSWSTIANVLVFEQPGGVGFSSCRHTDCPLWNDSNSAEATALFLANWKKHYSDFFNNEVYLVGESYAGVYIPMLADQIHKLGIDITLTGLGIGNGCIGYASNGACGIDNMRIFVDYMVGHGQIDEPTYSNIVKTCGEGLNTSTFSDTCTNQLGGMFHSLGSFNHLHLFSPCGPGSDGNWVNGVYSCEMNSTLSDYVTRLDVQMAMHVVPDTAKKPVKWNQWDGQWNGYNITEPNLFSLYKSLATRHRILVYNGDLDTSVPYIGSHEWVERLGFTIIDSWRPWSADGGTSAAGYVESFQSDIMFVTVRGAGHLVPADRPKAALSMISNFLNGSKKLPPYSGPCELHWMGRGWRNFCE